MVVGTLSNQDDLWVVGSEAGPGGGGQNLPELRQAGHYHFLLAYAMREQVEDNVIVFFKTFNLDI